jgi:hypothetical protein
MSPDGETECCMLAAAPQSGAVLYGIDGRAAGCRAQGVFHVTDVTSQIQYRSSRQERASGQLRQDLRKLSGACHQAMWNTNTA